jgi:hypothetical protein
MQTSFQPKRFHNAYTSGTVQQSSPVGTKDNIR